MRSSESSVLSEEEGEESGSAKFLKYLFFLPPLFLPFSLPPSLSSPSPLFPRARGAIVREIQRF